MRKTIVSNAKGIAVSLYKIVASTLVFVGIMGATLAANFGHLPKQLAIATTGTVTTLYALLVVGIVVSALKLLNAVDERDMEHIHSTAYEVTQRVFIAAGMLLVPTPYAFSQVVSLLLLGIVMWLLFALTKMSTAAVKMRRMFHLTQKINGKALDKFGMNAIDVSDPAHAK